MSSERIRHSWYRSEVFSLLRYLPWRSVIPDIAPSVNRKQTSIALVLVSHWRKDFLLLSLQRHSESVGIFVFRPWPLSAYRVKQQKFVILHRFVISTLSTFHHLRLLCCTNQAGMILRFEYFVSAVKRSLFHIGISSNHNVRVLTVSLFIPQS